MWKNTVEPCRPQMTIWRMRIACCITRAINTHSEYIILTAVPLPQWLHERSSLLRYTYVACLVHFPTFILKRLQVNTISGCRGYQVEPNRRIR